MLNSKLKEYIKLEFSLIFRNARPKFLLVLSSFFWLYGLIFLMRDDPNHYPPGLIIGYMAITGSFSFIYGTFFLSWESGFFKLLHSQPIDWADYLKAKFIILFLFCTINLLVAALYGFFDLNYLLFGFACFLYNVGINAYIILYFSKYNTNPIDLHKGSLFAEGTSMGQFLSAFFILVIPTGIYWMVQSLFNFKIALFIIGLIGVTGLVFFNLIIQGIAKSIKQEKFNLLKAYQQ